MNISVVIPARDAAETIADTLRSLIGQTHRAWEAIVVDDGSRDATRVVVEALARDHDRIRIIPAPDSGVGAARNSGIAVAHFEWLLFLDADDWILPGHLERLTAALAADAALDAAYCDSARVMADGVLVNEPTPPSGDLFPVLAQRAVFPIHACIVRRSIVECVGGFDPELRTCEDWDLWQRVARAGGRFRYVPELLALYRTRPGSASLDGLQMFDDGLRVLERGHSPDPRVKHPVPSHAGGASRDMLALDRVHYTAWTAGLLLGSGRDARSLLAHLPPTPCPDVDPASIASCLFRSTSLPSGGHSGDSVSRWATHANDLDSFLVALEGHIRAPGLPRRVRAALERLIVRRAATRPLTVGNTHALVVDIAQPVRDITVDRAVTRLDCSVLVGGEPLGALELPICDCVVPKRVLADAIAAEFGWLVIGRFFASSVYRTLETQRTGAALSVRRHGQLLADDVATNGDPAWLPLHERIFWPVFLQELWGRPRWDAGQFYDPAAPDESCRARRVHSSRLVVEVAEDLDDLESDERDLEVVFTIGGVAVGVTTIHAGGPIIRAQAVRAAITHAGGLELCRASVREGLIGHPFEASTSLRDRLRAAARRALSQPGWLAAPMSCRSVEGGVRTDRTIVLARRGQRMGTSASRYATLPSAAASDILTGATACGDPIARMPLPGIQAEHILYAPDIIGPERSQDRSRSPSPNAVPAASPYDRSHFEALFATGPDPWNYTTAYEARKYQETLELLPPGRIGRALELACAEGHFTAQLASRVHTLLAADISEIALHRAAERCRRFTNVRFQQLDLRRSILPGSFNLIVCSEVLYYMGTPETLAHVARKLVDALAPGGLLITAHANLVVDEPDQTGFDWSHPFGAKVISETLAAQPLLHLVREIRTPLYRVQLFQRRRRLLPRATPPPRLHFRDIAALPPAAAAQVRWGGAVPSRTDDVAPSTDRLPILMYHRVASTGAAPLAAYRVTPEAFGAQLRYLRDSGYYSVTLDEWHAAMNAYTPLPGRAVLITFDDGYRDFLTHAWPALRQYGFSATVFLVAGHIGGLNAWDHSFGEDSLLGWADIRRLRDEGIVFGSHSVTHRALTGLALEEVAREAFRSRSLLERHLSKAVTAFAYPYGDHDGVTRHLIGASGYTFGLSCLPGRASLHEPLLMLPRIEVTGSDRLEDFVRKLHG